MDATNTSGRTGFARPWLASWLAPWRAARRSGRARGPRPGRAAARGPAPAAGFTGLEPLEPRALLAAEFAWALSIGNSSDSAVRAVVFDHANNAYIAGEFRGRADFGGAERDSNGGSDAFAAMYDPAGRLVWVTSFGGGDNDSATDLAVDAFGNVIVVGEFRNAFTVGGLPEIFSNGGSDAFVVAIANPPAPDAASIVAATSLGGPGDDRAEAVAFDGTLAVVAGSFLGTVDFDPLPVNQTILTAGGDRDGFIWAADLAGDFRFRWVCDVGGLAGTETTVRDLHLGARGLSVAGSFNGTTQVRGAAGAAVGLASAGLRDAFVARYDADGNLQWARSFGGPGDDQALSVDLDRRNGDLVVAGLFSGNAVFDRSNGFVTALLSQGGQDAFATRLASDGRFLWARAIGGTNEDLLGGLRLDPLGDIYIAGSFVDRINLDPILTAPAFESDGARNLFLSILNPAGGFVEGAVTSGAAVANALGVAVNALGDIAIVGQFNGALDVDPGPNESLLRSVAIEAGLLLRLQRASPFFDEGIYLASNPDVAAAVGPGKTWRTGREHFETYGQGEVRRFSPFFDEAFYRAANPDVAANIGPGRVWRSGLAHFLTYGRFEARPATPLFDEAVYRAFYPDVGGAVGPGNIWASGYEHFLAYGLREKRLIAPRFDEASYLALNPDVAAAVGPGKTWASGRDHFVAFGLLEGRRVNGLFDEAVYLANNPDVAAAVGPGRTWASGLCHYMVFGQFERRVAV